MRRKRTNTQKPQGASKRIDFASANHLIQYIESMPVTPSRDAEYSANFCPFSFDEALHLLKNGWSDGVKSFGITGVAHDSTNTQEREAYNYDVTGDFFDLDAVIQGVPECCLYRENEIADKSGVDIYINIATSWSVSQQTITNRGAAIAELVDSLREKNSVRVILVSKAKSHEHNAEHTITITLDTDREYSRDSMAFMIANPAMLRRFIININEAHFGAKNGGHYLPLSFGNDYDGKIVFDKIEHNDNSMSNIDKAIQTIKEQYAMMLESQKAA